MSEEVEMRPICRATKERGRCKGCVNDKILCNAANEVADIMVGNFEKMVDIAMGLSEISNRLAREMVMLKEELADGCPAKCG